MSVQPQSLRIRAADFPDGLVKPEDVDKLGTLINPVLRQFALLSSNGVNLAGNMDATILSFNVTTPASDWADFAASGWANVGGAYSNFGWRRDALGALWLRGRINTLPALAATLATLPAGPTATVRLPVDANGGYGAIEVTSAGVISQVVGSIAGTLDVVGVVPGSSGAVGILSCWPQQIRIDDNRRPQAVFLLNARDTGSGPLAFSAGQPQWSYIGTNPGKPNLLSIDNLPGLAMGRAYALSVLVLYA